MATNVNLKAVILPITIVIVRSNLFYKCILLNLNNCADYLVSLPSLTAD